MRTLVVVKLWGKCLITEALCRIENAELLTYGQSTFCFCTAY
jgi:hypothetical protein